MAGFNLEIPDDFLKELTDKPFDKIAKDALDECAPILEKSVKASMRRAVKHSGDSDMIKSVRKNKPKQTKFLLPLFATNLTKSTSAEN